MVLSACGSGDGAGGGGANVEQPFRPAQESAVWTYGQTTHTGEVTTFTSDWVGTREIGGKSFGRLQAGSFKASPEPQGAEAWLEWTPNRIEFAGGEVYFPVPGVSEPGEPLVSGTVDEPLVIDLEPPVGVPQTLVLKGSANLGDPASPGNPYEIDTTITYTLEETDVTVETSVGDISGCSRFTGSAEAYGMTFEGECWYHPEMGMVAAHINWPEPNGTTLDLVGIQDFGKSDGTTGLMQSVGVVGPGLPSFRLSTYDANNEFDADKNKHAKMLIEVRWADEDKARTDVAPAVITEFGTVFGQFPHYLVPSPISIFHPEENGKGYTYWIALVDQAAKNESENGIAYNITAYAPDYASSNSRVSARIFYHRWTP